MLQKMKTSLGKDKVMDLLKNLMESDVGPPGDTEAASSSSKIARSHNKNLLSFLMICSLHIQSLMMPFLICIQNSLNCLKISFYF